MLKIIFIGDIMGKLGRKGVRDILPQLKTKYQPDLVLANGENLAHGKGMTTKTLEEITSYGVNFLSSGNHIWSKKDFIPKLDEPNINVIRPANYPTSNPGVGFKIIKTALLKKVLFINIIGRTFLEEHCNNPFFVLAKIIRDHQNEPDLEATIVDFHAETTAEKACLAYEFDGKITALLGTHTHVQTNDNRILPKGTGFISDAGMVGALNSSIGINPKEAIDRFKKGFNNRAFQIIETGEYIFNGVYLEVENGKCQKIEKIRLTGE